MLSLLESSIEKSFLENPTSNINTHKFDYYDDDEHEHTFICANKWWKFYKKWSRSKKFGVNKYWEACGHKYEIK